MSEWKIDIGQFNGPLDLLLQLIEKEELDITTISLAKIADEYFSYIKAHEFNPIELADFLVVASRLIYIKSKALLPYLVIEEEEEGSLEDQLKLYREYVNASKAVELILKKQATLYSREKIPAETAFRPPHKLTLEGLKEIMERVVHLLEPVLKIPAAIIQKTVSIKDRMEHLKDMLAKKAVAGFSHFVKDVKNRMEVVVSFLAVLELLKQRFVSVEQTELFSEIKFNPYTPTNTTPQN